MAAEDKTEDQRAQRATLSDHLPRRVNLHHQDHHEKGLQPPACVPPDTTNQVKPARLRARLRDI